MRRRIIGAFSKRLDEVGFEKVDDDRDPRGKRWPLVTVLRTIVLAIMTGAQSLADLEALTAHLSAVMRSRFHVPRRLPDTTARDILCGLEPEALIPQLHQVIRRASRRKAIAHDGLPFGVASLDGKNTTLPSVDDWFAQRQTQDESRPIGVVRTINAVLTSCAARPVIDVTTVPAHTNEMGWFESAFGHLLRAYPRSDLFRLITYDAGATSLDNANAVRQEGVHYLFGLKGTQPTLLEEAKRLLAGRSDEQCDAVTLDSDGTTRRAFLAAVEPGLCGWQHLRTFLRVSSTRTDKQGKVVTDTRYFLSSLPLTRLTAPQWLLVVRRHWGVETAHQVLDVAFKEDDRPWIEANPRGAAVVMVLRRIAYTLMTFFRSVTLRSEDSRSIPWKTLMRQVWTTLLVATEDDVAGLRRHALPAVPS
jgi:hypothetical protein